MKTEQTTTAVGGGYRISGRVGVYCSQHHYLMDVQGVCALCRLRRTARREEAAPVDTSEPVAHGYVQQDGRP